MIAFFIQAKDDFFFTEFCNINLLPSLVNVALNQLETELTVANPVDCKAPVLRGMTGLVFNKYIRQNCIQ